MKQRIIYEKSSYQRGKVIMSHWTEFSQDKLKFHLNERIRINEKNKACLDVTILVKENSKSGLFMTKHGPTCLTCLTNEHIKDIKSKESNWFQQKILGYKCDCCGSYLDA